MDTDSLMTLAWMAVGLAWLGLALIVVLGGE